jgi:transposase
MMPTGSAPPGRARHHRLHPIKDQPQRPIPHDTALYRQRHKIENMFGKLKDWRRIHTRYDRCAHTFMSAICIAATVIFWLPQ